MHECIGTVRHRDIGAEDGVSYYNCCRVGPVGWLYFIVGADTHLHIAYVAVRHEHEYRCVIS